MAEMLPVREGAKELARRAGRFARADVWADFWLRNLGGAHIWLRHLT